jgi:hypothetical protein
MGPGLAHSRFRAQGPGVAHGRFRAHNGWLPPERSVEGLLSPKKHEIWNHQAQVRRGLSSSCVFGHKSLEGEVSTPVK